MVIVNMFTNTLAIPNVNKFAGSARIVNTGLINVLNSASTKAPRSNNPIAPDTFLNSNAKTIIIAKYIPVLKISLPIFFTLPLLLS